MKYPYILLLGSGFVDNRESKRSQVFKNLSTGKLNKFKDVYNIIEDKTY